MSVYKRAFDQAQKKSMTLTKNYYNVKISEIENKIPSIAGLVTTAALDVVRNNIPSASNLVTKTGYDIKLSDIEFKYITTSGCHRLTGQMFDAKMKEKELVDFWIHKQLWVRQEDRNTKKRRIESRPK